MILNLVIVATISGFFLTNYDQCNIYLCKNEDLKNLGLKNYNHVKSIFCYSIINYSSNELNFIIFRRFLNFLEKIAFNHTLIFEEFGLEKLQFLFDKISGKNMKNKQIYYENFMNHHEKILNLHISMNFYEFS